jgi:uncharacterized protein
VIAFLHSFRGRIVTSDYVLDETFTLLFARYRRTASVAMRQLLKRVQAGQVQVERLSQAHLDTACQWRERYADKPTISFTDLTSMVLMHELSITDILTEDAHFTHVGLGFKLKP